MKQNGKARTASAFIRSQPKEMSVDGVIEAAKHAGFGKVTKGLVYNVRSVAKAKGKRVAKKVAKSKPKVVKVQTKKRATKKAVVEVEELDANIDLAYAKIFAGSMRKMVQIQVRDELRNLLGGGFDRGVG